MKTLHFIIIQLMLVGYASFSQINSNEVPNYPEWQVTLQVLDDGGLPLSNAVAYVNYYAPRAPLEPSSGARKTGATDADGIFVAHASSSALISYGAELPGYYSYAMEYEFREQADQKWLPWNQTFPILLKKTIHPIPMYAKWVNTHVPALDKTIGFDLMVGDWVAPYGKGKNKDILFRTHLESAEEESDYKLNVSFSNSGDGIQEFFVPPTRFPTEGSALRSSQQAPENGYKPEWLQTDIRKSKTPVKTTRDVNRNYYFRVRTVLDPEGGVKTALYGKIYGDFMHFRYYLNPTPNDRNMEFDPKKNLFTNLKSFERVEAP